MFVNLVWLNDKCKRIKSSQWIIRSTINLSSSLPLMERQNSKSALLHWGIFIILAVTWGSSFVLMKEGLRELSFTQVASLRIVFAGLVLLPVAVINLKTIAVRKIPVVMLSGVLGSLLPAYLFCAAETGISSSMAGVLNSLTPVFVLLFGLLFFKIKIPAIKIAGIALSFSGSILLYYAGKNSGSADGFFFILLIVIATMCYGANVNMVQKYLMGIPSLHIVAVAMGSSGMIALVVLWLTGFFEMDFEQIALQKSIGFTAILGILGTALASYLFYKLMKSAGAVFASMVTYAMPVVAILWGIVYKEPVNLLQVVSMLVILGGVYLAHKKKEVI